MTRLCAPAVSAAVARQDTRRLFVPIAVQRTRSQTMLLCGSASNARSGRVTEVPDYFRSFAAGDLGSTVPIAMRGGGPAGEAVVPDPAGALSVADNDLTVVSVVLC